MATENTEGRELELVGKVELRIAMASSDQKFESLLNTYLAPLLLKLTSEHASVRNKVISICQHVNTRIKSPLIKLPVAALLKQYKDNQSLPIRHFDLLYIQQGVGRMPTQDRLKLLPILLAGISHNFEESTHSTATLFNLLLRLLHNMIIPPRGGKEDTALRSELGFDEGPHDAQFVASWLGKLMLLTVKMRDPAQLPALSKEDAQFLNLYGKETTWEMDTGDGISLPSTKYIAARFLASGAFVDSERYLPALIMSVDPNYKISEIGEDILKRAVSAISLEDETILKSLLTLYLGTRGAEGSLPASPPLQAKILSQLSKSRLVSSYVDQSVQIIQEALAPKSITQSEGLSTSSQRGLQASKLRQHVFAFSNWLARMGSAEDLAVYAPKLVGLFQDYIESQGWPRPGDSEALDTAELTSRAYGYEGIGSFAAASPRPLLVEPDIHLLRWLFTSLSEDSCGQDVSISIDQSLSSVLGAFGHDVDPDIESSLRALLLHHMSLSPGRKGSENVVKSTRFTALKFANRCLPFYDVDARWTNLLAICRDSQERREVVEEGRRGLDPYWFRLFNPLKGNKEDKALEMRYELPDVVKLITRFFGPGTQWDALKLSKPGFAQAYSYGLTFCRNVLLHQSLTTQNHPVTFDSNWEQSITALVANDPQVRIDCGNYFCQRATNEEFRRAVHIFLRACLHGLAYSRATDSHRAGDHFIEIFSLADIGSYAGLADEAYLLTDAILSSDSSVQERAAHVFGLLSSSRRSQSAMRSVQTFHLKVQSWKSAVGSELLQISGSILALGCFYSRLKGRRTTTDEEREATKALLRAFVDVLGDARDSTLVDATLGAISEMALFGVIEDDEELWSRNDQELYTRVLEKCKKGNERAISTVGYLAMQCPEEDDDSSLLSKIIGNLYDLHTIRQAEVQFTVGASLACAASGWQSRSLVAANDIHMEDPSSLARGQTLSIMLEKILGDCKTTKPSLRQASVIWLLCLVQYCGHLPEIRGRLPDCQIAFKSFLSDRDSLNQESASRGLTLVYEQGDKSLKEDLIRDLISSFTGTRSGLAGNVSGDTELFDAGALPTGEGSVTTYKDIMSLASEVGDASLVYRFMSLAANNAIWSSRAAFGRFGLSNVLNDASTDGYLAQNPKLYSALFRYRFDPNTNVRTSMNDIWTALVKDPAATVNKYFDTIIQDLMKTILGKEWRVRQASCAAIADIIQGRPFELYEKYLNEIWTVTFKVCDDIKESVRAAAMSLARVLTGILTRELEGSHHQSQKSEKMLKRVLPFLLSPSGLESSAPDVQNFARKALLEIIKKGSGPALRPFVPELIGRLLALLSSIEPEMVNYLHLNADKYGVTTDEIDDARLKHVRGSSMLEAIERCLDILDESSMSEFTRYFENAIKTVIGLPSKVGCSRVVVSLSTRRNFLFKPYADHFLPVVRKQVFDRNDTISSSYAAACGYLARLASDRALLEVIDSCQRLYFDSEEDRQRDISGEIVYALSKYATDRFNSVASDVLPFVFVAKHDVASTASLPFERTWDENVGGSRAVLLYLREISQLINRYLDSPRWSVKHTSALAIADVVKSSGNNISEANAKAIWPVLEKALSLKTWDGKEKLLQSFVQFCKNSDLIKSDKNFAKTANKIMIREVKRTNPTYRREALGCFAEFVELHNDGDRFEEVNSVVAPLVQQILGSSADEMDVDLKAENSSTKNVREATVQNATKTLVRSIDPATLEQTALEKTLDETMGIIEQVNGSELSSGQFRGSMYPEIRKLFANIQANQRDTLSNSFSSVLARYGGFIVLAIDDVEKTRAEAAEAAVVFAHVAKFADGEVADTFTARLTELSRRERSDTIRRALQNALNVIAPGEKK